MSTFHFLLDEHVDPALRSGLRRLAPHVEMWRIGDPGTPVRGTADPGLLVWCDASRFILLTDNRRTMPVHLQDHLAAGRHVPGVFVLGELSLGETMDELFLIVTASDPEEYLDRIVYLPVSR